MKAVADDYYNRFVEGPWSITAINLVVGSDLIIGISLTSESGKGARVSFAGVRNLRLTHEAQTWPLSLQVADIRDRRWEDLNFSVEGEQGDFAFYCRDITVER